MKKVERISQGVVARVILSCIEQDMHLVGRHGSSSNFVHMSYMRRLVWRAFCLYHHSHAYSTHREDVISYSLHCVKTWCHTRKLQQHSTHFGRKLGETWSNSSLKLLNCLLPWCGFSQHHDFYCYVYLWSVPVVDDYNKHFLCFLSLNDNHKNDVKCEIC